MSSYLNLYLVPKKKEDSAEDQKPLLFQSWSRNNDMYSLFYDHCNPIYIGNEDKPKYSELNLNDLLHGITEEEEIIDKSEQRLNDRLVTIKELGKSVPKEVIDEYLEELLSTKEYIDDTRKFLNEARVLHGLLSNLERSDFEKVLINID